MKVCPRNLVHAHETFVHVYETLGRLGCGLPSKPFTKSSHGAVSASFVDFENATPEEKVTRLGETNEDRLELTPQAFQGRIFFYPTFYKSTYNKLLLKRSGDPAPVFRKGTYDPKL